MKFIITFFSVNFIIRYLLNKHLKLFMYQHLNEYAQNRYILKKLQIKN